jgi:hypothetical protein
MPSPPPYSERALPAEYSETDAPQTSQHEQLHRSDQTNQTSRPNQPPILVAPPSPPTSTLPKPHAHASIPSIPYSTSTGITIPPHNPQCIHIVYVHGFQGDHTTFQAFPSDLHNYLLTTLPGLQTWIYPTYKSAKPLSFAARNLLIW